MRRSPKPGCLDREHVDDAPQLVHDQRRERLAVDILGDDEDVLAAGLEHLLERREHVRDGRDLLVRDEDVGLVEGRLHAAGVGHEVGAGVAPVELHALDVLGLEGHGLGFLDRDDAVLAGLVEDVRDEVADLLVGGADGRDLGDLVVALDRHATPSDRLRQRLLGGVDADLHLHRVGARGDVLEALGDDRLGQHRGGGGAVAGHVLGLGGGFLEQLRAHVLERVVELDVAGHGHAVMGDGRRAELLVQGDVAALGAEGRAHGIRQGVDAAASGGCGPPRHTR